MKALWCDYNWIEDSVRTHTPALRRATINDVVAIQRGGLFPAMVAAHILDVPVLHSVSFDRHANRPKWVSESRPAANARVLLVDDIAGAGNTLVNTKLFLEQQGYSVKTLAIGYDAKSRLIPDFGHDFAERTAVFPWERHRLNRAFAEDMQHDRGSVLADSAYEQVGLDLDGIFAPDLSSDLYQEDLPAALRQRASLQPFAAADLPPHSRDQALIVTSRHLDSRDATLQWLETHGFGGYQVVFRDPAEYPDNSRDGSLSAARYKIDMVQRHALTSFYESDVLQAAYMASMLALVEIFCWNNPLGIRLRMGRTTIIP
jgi:hypoxanthine phosphoribosyltransferase